MKSSKSIVPWPCRSNFRTKVPTKFSDNLYPKVVKAFLSSFWSMFPELSRSKDRKQLCQSVTYFHKAPKSSKLMLPLLCLSNIPIYNIMCSDSPLDGFKVLIHSLIKNSAVNQSSYLPQFINQLRIFFNDCSFQITFLNYY